MKSQCQNCSEVWPDDELDPIKDLHQRVAPGEPMPTGECPSCGCLCQPVDDEPSDAEIERMNSGPGFPRSCEPPNYEQDMRDAGRGHLLGY